MVFDKNSPQAIEVTKNGVPLVKGSLEYYHDGDKAFSLKDLADYMGVNRSAMFRELKRLKEDHLIEVKGKRITLLYK